MSVYSLKFKFDQFLPVPDQTGPGKQKPGGGLTSPVDRKKTAGDDAASDPFVVASLGHVQTGWGVSSCAVGALRCGRVGRDRHWHGMIARPSCANQPTNQPTSHSFCSLGGFPRDKKPTRKIHQVSAFDRISSIFVGVRAWICGSESVSVSDQGGV